MFPAISMHSGVCRPQQQSICWQENDSQKIYPLSERSLSAPKRLHDMSCNGKRSILQSFFFICVAHCDGSGQCVVNFCLKNELEKCSFKRKLVFWRLKGNIESEIWEILMAPNLEGNYVLLKIISLITIVFFKIS